MIVLIGAIILGVLMAILFFAFNYVRMLGAHEQQRTAIEAAALQAARDITKIVVDDPNFGLVSLSDVAPNGSNTAAGDGYDLPVLGINTLIATVRLDMIIADQFNDPVMQSLALRDYTNAMATVTLLNQTLTAAVQGGTGTDADGNVLNPVQDATNAYNQNSVRMMGINKCTLVPNSLVLTLGCITNEPTSTPIPQPAQYAQMSSSQQQNGYYFPYVDIPYDTKDFVFAATATDVHLVDSKKVQATISGLPYQLPTIIICQADEIYKRTDNTGQQSTDTVHAKACAEPACMVDNLPCPGALQLTFPNGRPSVITMMQDIMTSSSINTSPADYVMTPSTDDSPPATMNAFEIVPGATQHPNFGTVMRVAIYDWIRRGRMKPNLQSLATFFATAFQETSPQTSAHALYFNFAQDGSVSTTCQAIDPGVYAVVSQNQYFAATGLAVHDVNNSYDVFIKDYSFILGRQKGGKHAGEPFGTGGTSMAPTPMFSGAGWISEGVTSIMQFMSGTGIRPTYQNSGTSVEVIMRQRS